MHANLCMYNLAFTFQDGGNPFPVTRLPVLNSVTESSRHTLLLPALHSQWSRQVYIIHRSITGFFVVQEPIGTQAHEYRLLGASCLTVNNPLAKFEHNNRNIEVYRPRSFIKYQVKLQTSEPACRLACIMHIDAMLWRDIQAFSRALSESARIREKGTGFG